MRLPAQDGLPPAQRAIAMLGIALGVLTSVMDGAIANVALPTIAADLGATPAASVWVVNAYQLAVCVALLPVAAIGEIVGYRRVFAVGFTVFTIASLCCALSPTLLTLSLSRALQGMGGATMMALSPPLVRLIYPRHQIGRGVGLVGFFVAVSAAAGPSAASAILAVAHWPWLFAVNLPIGVVGLVVTSRVLPHRPGSGGTFDWRGAVLNAGALGLLVTGIDRAGIEGPHLGPLAQIGGGVVCFVVLLRNQTRQAKPLLPLDLLRIPLFALSMATSLCSYAAQMMTFVAVPFLLQKGLGLDAVHAGLLITPWPLMLAITAPVAGRLADRYPPGLLGGVGLALMALGTVTVVLLHPAPADWDVAWRMGLTGLGFGLFQAPNNKLLITTAPPHRAGAAGGLQAAARLVGQTFGGAFAALIFAAAGTAGPHDALITAAVLSVAGAAVSMSRIGR